MQLPSSSKTTPLKSKAPPVTLVTETPELSTKAPPCHVDDDDEICLSESIDRGQLVPSLGELTRKAKTPNRSPPTGKMTPQSLKIEEQEDASLPLTIAFRLTFSFPPFCFPIYLLRPVRLPVRSSSHASFSSLHICPFHYRAHFILQVRKHSKNPNSSPSKPLSFKGNSSLTPPKKVVNYVFGFSNEYCPPSPLGSQTDQHRLEDSTNEGRGPHHTENPALRWRQQTRVLGFPIS